MEDVEAPPRENGGAPEHKKLAPLAAAPASAADMGPALLPPMASTTGAPQLRHSESLYAPDTFWVQRSALLLLLNGGAMVAFVFLFSGMGEGLSVFDLLLDHYSLGKALGGGGVVALLLLYIFDATYWDPVESPIAHRVKHVVVCGAFTSIAVGFIFAAKNPRFAMAPMALFMVVVPAFTVGVKRYLFRATPLPHFLSSMSVALLVCSVLLGAIWVSWAADGHWWGPAIKLEYAWHVCPALAAGHTVALAQGDAGHKLHCLVAYLIWFAPMMASIACFLFGCVVFFLGRSLGGRKTGTTKLALKLFIMTLFMSMLGTWVASSVAGAGMKLTNALMPCIVFGLCVMGATIGATVGWHKMREEAMKMGAMHTAVKLMESDWIKGMFMWSMSPFFVIYLFISAINQRVRVHWSVAKTTGRNEGEKGGSEGKIGGGMSKAEEDALWVTLVAHRQLEGMKKWAWSSVLVKSVYIGGIYITLNVIIGKLVVLLLSGLNTFIKDQGWPLATTTCIFFVIGFTMFLLPPVPGVPVYLAGGVILTSAAEGSGMSFGASCLFSIGVCFGIKLAAICVQQKGFGERLGSNVTVRTFCQVNSISIRAISRILDGDGLTKGKVAILCGGPDWPTSVLTGILGKSLVQMLLGSMPVIFLVAPCALAGAFQLKKTDSAQYASLAGITLALATMTQMLALLASLYYIEKCASDHGAELRAMKDDEEVKEVEHKKALKRAVYRRVTNWHEPGFPRWVKALLVLAWLAMLAATFLVLVTASKCFETYEITDTIDEKLKGDWTNIVIWDQFGTYFCVALLIVMLCLKVFSVWAGRRGRGRIHAADGHETHLTFKSGALAVMGSSAAGGPVKTDDDFELEAELEADIKKHEKDGETEAEIVALGLGGMGF